MTVPDAGLMAALDVKRELAAHTAECAQRQKRIEEILGEIKNDVKDQGGRMRTIEDSVTERNGGWKVIAAAGAVGAGIMAAAAEALPYLGSVIR